MKNLLLMALGTMMTIGAEAQCVVNTFDGVARPRKISAADFRTKKGQAFPIDTLMWNGPEAINLVLMGDGYTADEQEKFQEAAEACYDGLFKKLPFSLYKSWFNLLTVGVVSRESGTSMPGVYKGGKYVCPEGQSHDIYTRDTYFEVAFDSYNIHRLCCPNAQILYETVNALVPDYDVVGVITNTEEYGGSGGSYLCLSTHKSAQEVFIHEFGHTFAGLADEYYAGDNYLIEKPNVTADPNKSTIKWSHWWGKGSVGAYKIGGSTMGNKWYKPVNGTCEMEYLNKNFCPVCREHIIETLHESMGMMSEYSPAAENLTIDNEDVTFAVTRYHKGHAGYMTWEWTLDGEVIAGATGETYTLKGSDLSAGVAHWLELRVRDNSPYVLSPDHTLMHTNTVRWSIRNLATGISVQKADGVKVMAVRGGLRVSSEEPRLLAVYTIGGQRVCHKRVHGTEFIALEAGVYVVDGMKVKVGR